MDPQIHISNHPLVKHKLTILRDAQTSSREFRRLVRDLSILLGVEATTDVAFEEKTVQTPVDQATGITVTDRIGLVPIMRAGMGMAEGLTEFFPNVQVWHLGMYRDEETLEPVPYYNRLPDEATVSLCLVVDPMLATGGSAIKAVEILKSWGARRIKFVGILAAPEGIDALHRAHPEVDIHVAHIDERLNDVGFIVPGLGDAGDRYYGGDM